MSAGTVTRLVGVYDADGELAVLLGPERLEACNGAPDAMFAEIDREIRARELQFA